ncbi:type II secretion system F family protein [Candidatus Uhrbacteria bacterium]|nr:type II secretion system F family protein [Candidatus Uhrbacteria bacterium]
MAFQRLHQFWQRLNIQLSAKERLVFAKYLAVLLGAGLPIDEAINVLKEQSKRSLARILEGLSVHLKQGDTLAAGLADFPYVFSPLFINLVASGEASGNLQENLKQLVVQMQEEYELNGKIRGAMVYPIVIITVALLIAAGIFIFVLPNVIGLFESLKVELPLTTRILIAIAQFVTHHGTVTAISVFGFIIAVLVARKIAWFRPAFHRFALLMPIFGGIVKKVNLARMTRSLGTMLHSGIPIDEAINITRSTVNNIHYQRLFDELKTAIELGGEVSSVFKKHPHLVPPMASRVIFVGEQAGSLDEMLMYLADFYEQEVSEVTKNLSDLIEPFLLILIGVFVGGIALSIMTPIYQVLGSF